MFLENLNIDLHIYVDKLNHKQLEDWLSPVKVDSAAMTEKEKGFTFNF